jgi:hypothetical protein
MRHVSGIKESHEQSSIKNHIWRHFECFFIPFFCNPLYCPVKVTFYMICKVFYFAGSVSRLFRDYNFVTSLYLSYENDRSYLRCLWNQYKILKLIEINFKVIKTFNTAKERWSCILRATQLIVWICLCKTLKYVFFWVLFVLLCPFASPTLDHNIIFYSSFSVCIRALFLLLNL